MAENKKKGINYAWVIAICCTLMVCATSLISSGMSTNLNAMRQHFGLTNTQTSLVLTIRSASALVAALVSIRFFKLVGIRNAMLTAMGCGAMTFVCFACSGGNMVWLLIGGFFGGICYSYGMMLPASIVIKNWFTKSRGTALGIASCGTGLVSVIFAPVVQKIVNGFGITAAFIFQGCFMIFTGLIIFFFV